MNRQLTQLVWERAAETCEYCRLAQAMVPLPFQIDHVIAEQHGGETVAENLALSCLHCNKYKGPNIASVDPVSGKIVALFHPRRQKWQRHFHWQGPILVGRTQAARATIRALAMNDSLMVALRQALLNEGVFPNE